MTEEKINIKDLETEFYSKKFYLSYSGLGKFLYSPSLFYRHYVLQQKEEKLDSYLIEGKVIHCLLLDDGSFDKQFILMPSSLPSGNTKLVVDKVYDRVKEGPGLLENYSVEIVEILKEINLHQSLKTDQQRVDKIVTEETKSYFEFLKVKGSKDLIDSATLQKCSEAVEAVRNDPKACSLLGLLRHEMENIDVYNEIPMQAEVMDVYPFGLKGIIDNIKVDYDTKTIHINDLKTSGKTLDDFEETIEYFNYWAQAAIYLMLVRENMKELITPDWNIVFHFIVIDKYNQVYAFEVSKVTLMAWEDMLTKKLNEFQWHYREKKYTLPYKYMFNQVML